MFCLGMVAPLFADDTNQLADEKSRVSYALGMMTGHQWKQQELDFDTDTYARGIKDALAGGTTLLTPEEAQQAIDAFKKEFSAKQQERKAGLAIKNKAEGDAFLAANKDKPGVQVLPDGLQYLVLTNGTGPTPTASDTVTVNYRGTLIDGTMRPAKNGYGRIKFGTESSGGFRNCTVANCTFRSCHGLALEEVDGGIMDNITINNLTMMDVRDYAIYITTGKRNRTPGLTTSSRARNILISNVLADGVDKMSGIQISGLPEQPVEGVRLENIRLTSKGGGTANDAAINPQELGTGYPEPGKLGILPAYGIFARHVKGLELANISVNFITNDLRPAGFFADIQGLEIDNFKPQMTEGVPAAVFADNVSGLIIRNSPALASVKK